MVKSFFQLLLGGLLCLPSQQLTAQFEEFGESDSLPGHLNFVVVLDAAKQNHGIVSVLSDAKYTKKIPILGEISTYEAALVYASVPCTFLLSLTT